MWQMSDNSAFNLSPAGAKCARRQTDAAVIRGTVDSWLSWNWILTHQNVLIRMSGWSRAPAPFSLFKVVPVLKGEWGTGRKNNNLMPLTDKFNREKHFTWRALFTCFPVEAAAAGFLHVYIRDSGMVPREASEWFGNNTSPVDQHSG